MDDSAFAEAVAARHLQVDPGAWEDIYVVGDVHGCLAELETLLARLAPSPDDLVLFVGDLVRKGPDSAGVVERVRTQENLVSVRGNNEDKLIRGAKELPELDPHTDYIESLPVVVSWADQLVVHGGVDPRLPLADHDVETLLNFRSVPPENGYDGPFWFEHYDGPLRVFFGHTVLDEPVVTDSAVGLDTGCVYGGALTAYDVTRAELVSVPAEQEYLPRADRKIIEPP